MATTHDRVMAVIDVALTTPVRAAGIAGRWSPRTAEEYLTEWGKAEDWLRAERRAVEQVPVRIPRPDGPAPLMPWSPETLARYAGHLAQQERAPATIRKALAAVRAWHRLHGQPVPDGVPALAVLRDHETTLRASGWKPRRTDALTFDEALAILAAIDRSTVRGRRDACILLLAYGGMLTSQQLVALRLRDLEVSPAGLRVRRQAGDDWLLVPHWTVDGAHHPTVCPVEAVDVWARYLRGRGCGGFDPLIRPIADGGRVAGLDPFSGRVAANGSMAAAGLGPVLTKMLEQAGVDDPSRYSMRSLRVGGIVRRRLDGLDVDQLAAESGMVTLLEYVRTAERLQIGSMLDGPR